MSEHFIRNIEIKNFKCFEDFKAEGFGRVNLIGGKNNVGKTAFMEAIYINSSKEDIDTCIKNIIFARYISDITLDLFDEIGKKYIDNFLNKKSEVYRNIFLTSNIKQNINVFFINNIKSHKDNYEEYYSYIIRNELENRVDNYIKKFDNNIERFRIIKGKPHCKKNGEFYNLYEFGDGLAKFIFFILVLLSANNKIILIDEIENGIHYSKLDEMWQIILTLSKQQNVQVFATTHSKECIESYARVAKKLEDEDVKFIGLHKLKDGSIISAVRDLELLELTIEQEHEVR